MIAAALVALALAGACFAYRLLRGPTLADRVVGLDGLLVVGACALAADAVRTGSGAFVNTVVVVTLVGFVSTSLIARFIEGRGV
jgi:multicomponent Na+:H+ antiporter subunit F